MARSAPTATVESIWKTVMEGMLFVFPVVFGLLLVVGGIGAMMGSAGQSAMGIVAALGYLVLIGVGLISVVVFPIALYLDAEAINDAGLDWEPMSILYAIFGFLFTGLTAMHYLYKRYKYTADATTRSWWWYLIAAYVVAFSIGGVLFGLNLPIGLSMLGLFGGLLPVAIYKDAAHVRTRSDGWLPNPMNYFVAAVFGHILLVVPLLLSIYYLFRRYRAIGLS